MSENDEKSENTFTGLGDLSSPDGAVKARRRVGRGVGSGRGKTSTRGHKGQKSRSGYSRKVGFRGWSDAAPAPLAETRFQQPASKKKFAELNVGRLDVLAAGASVDADTLQAAGLIRKVGKDGVKLLGDGEVDRAIHLKVQKCSESARRKIESAGGSVEIVALAAKPEDKSE